MLNSNRKIKNEPKEEFIWRIYSIYLEKEIKITNIEKYKRVYWSKLLRIFWLMSAFPMNTGVVEAVTFYVSSFLTLTFRTWKGNNKLMSPQKVIIKG